MAKIQTVGTVSEFISGEYKVKEARKRAVRKAKLEKVAEIASSMAIPVALGSPLGAVAVGAIKASGGLQVFGSPSTLTASAEPVMVQVPNAGEWLGEKSMSALAHALDPLLDVLVALSFPICSVVIVGSCFWFMFGKSDLAWKNIQNAGLGYCIIQLSPFILDLLKNIGNAL